MDSSFESWERKYYAESDGEAFLFYVAFGNISQDMHLEERKYRCSGVPAGFELSTYDKVRDADVFDGFLEGYLWEQLNTVNPRLARTIQRSSTCAVFRGSQKNPETLDYLRDCVGLLTFLLDNGACSIYDPQMFHWWTPEQWHERLFDPAAAVPTHHVMILFSEEEGPKDLFWVHTRGMRKFGRPDISVHRVGRKYEDAVIDLCNRFIEYEAFGGLIPEGQEIRMALLPPGGVAHHGGDLDDPDFNNVHVEIVWPKRGLVE
jgi:hypothetical protein